MAPKNCGKCEKINGDCFKLLNLGVTRYRGYYPGGPIRREVKEIPQIRKPQSHSHGAGLAPEASQPRGEQEDRGPLGGCLPETVEN